VRFNLKIDAPFEFLQYFKLDTKLQLRIATMRS
jgi:hypothetical protein